MYRLLFLLIFFLNSNSWACQNATYWYVWKESFWKKSDQEIKSLAQKMSAQDISEVILPLERELPAGITAEIVQKKLATFRQELEKSSGGKKVSLFALLNPGTRSLNNFAPVISKAKEAWSAGFDGVQIDIEPVSSGDQRFVQLLEAVKKEKPDEKKLSIASYLLTSSRAEAHSLQSENLLYWDVDYFKQIMPSIDHLTVMNYDTGKTGEEYAALTRDQFNLHSNLLNGGNVEWRMGVPAYKYGRHKNKFHGVDENVTYSLSGLKSAITPQSCPKNFGLITWLFNEVKTSEWDEIKSFQNWTTKGNPIKPTVNKSKSPLVPHQE